MECSTKHGSENDIREFTYDPDGNMTSDGRGIYKYDSLNRMTEAVMEDGRKLTCRYDAEGLRHETEENGRLIRFIYSGRDAVCEEEDDNITRYIRGNGRLVASDSENARTYYHYACDSLGSITHVIAGNEFGNGETNGDVNSRILCRYDYDAFGNTINAEETIANRYCFTGEMYDDITDMYYLKARYYATNTGRFTQTDTYHGDGLNLYVYAGNNPVKYVDPSGNACKENGFSKTFYTVQNCEDVKRLLSDGLPWPTEPERANLGDGVYAWSNIEDAINYLNKKRKRTSNLQILEFEVSKADLSKMKQLDLTKMSDDEVNIFLDRYARLNGGTPNNEYDYIRRMTGFGIENYFNKSVFEKLKFKH